MHKEYNQSPRQVLEDLHAAETGLSGREAETRLGQYGPNRLREAPKATLLQRFLQQLKDPMLLILMAAAAVSAVTNYLSHEPFTEVLIILAVVLLNAVLGVVQESKAEAAIEALQTMTAATSKVLRGGSVTELESSRLVPGDIVLLEAGDAVPADGRLLACASLQIEEAALTGESLPREVREGDEIISGCINMTGVLKVRTTKAFGESTVSKILELVENSSEKKAVSEQFITRFAKYYTPCVVYAALALFLIPTVLLAVLPTLPGFLAGTVWTDWLHRALTFLVISCPCALVISVPLSFFGGIGGASKCGILVKGGNYLEALAKADTVVFDKTGTLTKGTFAVSAVHPEAGFEADQVLEYAALAEQYSTHPIAVSLREACKSGMDRSRVSNVEEIAGHGIMAEVDGKRVGVGNSRLMERQSVNWLPCELPGTIVHVTIDGFYAGHIVIADQPKPDAKEAIAQLKAMGVKKTVMLTGDTKEVAHTVADALGLDEYHAELLPADKVARVEELLKQETGKLAFVGDGINDAPVLTRADIGIAMGGLGSDAAIEAADIVLMDDQPTKIAAAIRIARKTVRIVRENIVFALTVKAIVLVMGALGKAPMWLAVFADVGVAFLAILNAMRCLYTEKDKK